MSRRELLVSLGHTTGTFTVQDSEGKRVHLSIDEMQQVVQEALVLLRGVGISPETIQTPKNPEAAFAPQLF